MIEPEAWQCVTWWQDYTRLRVLPGPETNLMDAPAYVFEAIKACDGAMQEIEASRRQQEIKAADELKRKAEAAAAKAEKERRR